MRPRSAASACWRPAPSTNTNPLDVSCGLGNYPHPAHHACVGYSVMDYTRPMVETFPEQGSTATDFAALVARLDEEMRSAVLAPLALPAPMSITLARSEDSPITVDSMLRERARRQRIKIRRGCLAQAVLGKPCLYWHWECPWCGYSNFHVFWENALKYVGWHIADHQK